MGVLRLLYCDSAGVRRCRGVPYKGVLPGCHPADSVLNIDAVQPTLNPNPAPVQGTAATAIATDPNLQPTPSLIEAAAAGVITLGPLKANHGSISQPQQQQQQQQQPPVHIAAALTPAQAASAGPFASRSAALAAVSDNEQASAVHNGTNHQYHAAVKSPARSQQLTNMVSASIPASGADAAVKSAAKYGAGLTMASMGQPVIADMMVPGSGVSPVGEVRLVPDLSSAVQLPWTDGHSMAPADMWERDLSRPSPLCPRSALKNALRALEKAHDIKLLLGFELEFTLLKPAPASAAVDSSSSSSSCGSSLVIDCGCEGWVPVDDSIYCQSSAFDQMAPVLDKMVSTLESMGIQVLQYHAESGPGQFEIATAPYPSLQAVDKLLLTKEVISAVARQSGLQVSFLPKPYKNMAGCGCHCHISLWQAHTEPDNDSSSSSNGSSLMTVAPGIVPVGRSSHASGQCAPEGYPTLTNTAAAFLAGLLEHLPGLLPFTAPINNSFARLQPLTWSGAYLCWGYDNREAPLRVCCPDPDRPETTNIEYKALDGTANPYIAVAAMVAAGMRGLQEATILPPPCQTVPGLSAGDDAETKLGPLPATLKNALAALEEDNSLMIKLQQLLGQSLLKAFLAVRRFEAEKVEGSEMLLLRYS